MAYPIPRLPVFDWKTFSGNQASETHCLLDHPQTHFTHSGRASILLALEMLAIGPGDKVLVPTYHCPTMIAPVIARGAQPVFYPLNADGAPNLEWIKRLDTQGQRIRAILVAHFFGLPQPLAEIRQWCNKQAVNLIEDCAHALFGTSDNKTIGAWGDLAIASLTKFLPVPEGGCLVNNMRPGPIPPLHQPRAIGQIKAGLDIVHVGVNHGRLKGVGSLVRGLYGLLGALKPAAHVPQPSSTPSVAEGFTIDPVQSHRALTYASRWMADHAPRERIVAKRRAGYTFLSNALSGLSGMRPVHASLPEDCAPYVFPLWVDHPDPGYAELRRLEFPVSRWDRLWPDTPTIETDCGPVWSRHILQLACHQDLTEVDMAQMVKTLKQVYAPAKDSH
jgi:perosamine synthetase